ncbi:hypothetical protein SJ05684_c10210 [Sinorhizobium sojae CCBAU 05684]|uniref:Uncharacterized protein n=1 Tax=Sinorhizobium sojae CCBAU 05684 TaxID=716928 RepID=A0A249PB19_9HYPH|nr:hypothetical protein [Sinorhizobium sojae]ASY62479.1 hypothetical protein SJ05684_c10210 [Sinorhizobium sojae CCBAU 05684]
MSDCRTCKHNAYRDIKDCEWVCCAHPVTIAKAPRPEAGDPSWVNAMTADIRASEMDRVGECSTWEPMQ